MGVGGWLRKCPLLPLCSQAAVSHSKLDWTVMEFYKIPEYSEWTAYISFFPTSEDFQPKAHTSEDQLAICWNMLAL